jgi:hypothetical protein
MSNETNQTHHADCGDVGETGVHGDLGSNAAGAERETSAEDAADLRSLGIDATSTAKGIEVKVPAANPLVTHNTGAK